MYSKREGDIFATHSVTAPPPYTFIEMESLSLYSSGRSRTYSTDQVDLQLRDHLPLPKSWDQKHASQRLARHCPFCVEAKSLTTQNHTKNPYKGISLQINKAKLPVDCWPINGELSSRPLTAIMLTTYSVPGLRSVMVKEFREGGIRSCLGLPTACSA